MSWLDRLRAVFRPEASYGSLEERAFSELVRANNVSGVTVTEHTALAIPAVWACVKVIAESLAMLPIDVVERTAAGRRVLEKTDGNGWLLNYTPDGVMPAFDLRCSMAAHMLLWGNGYAEIERDKVGRVYALHLVPPDRVDPKVDDGGELIYEVRNGRNEVARLPARDVLHWRGLSWDGMKGYSTVAHARQSLGLSSAMETFGAAFFGNGAQLGTRYTTEQSLKQEQIKDLREQVERLHGGARNAFKAAILHSGMKVMETTMPLEDAQFLESRRFQVLEIARWFRVPPHLLAELERATHSNVEQEQLAFVTHCLQPHAARFEAEANIKLFGRNQAGRQVVKHNFGALLRGDMKTRAETLQIMRRNGVLNANEWRELEDRNPIGSDGETYIVEANMTTIEQIENPPEPVAPPAPLAAPEEPDSDDTDSDDPENNLQAARERMRVVRSARA